MKGASLWASLAAQLLRQEARDRGNLRVVHCALELGWAIDSGTSSPSFRSDEDYCLHWRASSRELVSASWSQIDHDTHQIADYFANTLGISNLSLSWRRADATYIGPLCG